MKTFQIDELERESVKRREDAVSKAHENGSSEDSEEGTVSKTEPTESVSEEDSSAQLEELKISQEKQKVCNIGSVHLNSIHNAYSIHGALSRLL